MLVALVSDTHAPRRWKACPAKLAERLKEVDVILHAGDVCTPGVLDELSTYAPVHAVIGNNDGPDIAAWGATPTFEAELAGVNVAMIHDSGPTKGRPARLRKRFPDAQLVVFGHSHIPWDHDEQGQRSINPGSPTDRRRQPHGTFALVELDAGRIVSAEILTVIAFTQPPRGARDQRVC